MRTISEVANQELIWVQPARTKQTFELRAGEEVVANLRWQRSSLASGDTADQRWTFKREGFWHPRITVRLPDSDTNAAVFHPSWAGGGTLELPPGGRVLRFGAANFWHSQWQWLDTDGKPLVHFKSNQGFVKTEGRVEVQPDAIGHSDLPLLAVLGWYLLVLFARDAAAQASAAAVASTA